MAPTAAAANAAVVPPGSSAAAAADHANRAAALRAAAAQSQQELDKLAATLSRRTPLSDALNRATTRAAAASASLTSAKAEDASFDDPRAIVVGSVQAQSKRPTVVKYAGLAFVAAFVLMVGVFLLLGRQSDSDAADTEQ